MGAAGCWFEPRVLKFRPKGIGIVDLQGEGYARAVAAFDGGAAFIGNAQARTAGEGELDKPLRSKGDGQTQLVAIEGNRLAPGLTVENRISSLRCDFGHEKAIYCGVQSGLWGLLHCPVDFIADSRDA